MRNAKLYIIFFLVFASCVGCGRGGRVDPPVVVVDPNANEHQQFIVSVAGRVDQIAGIRGRLQYNIADNSCVPMDYKMALGGIRPTFTMDPPLEMVPVGSDTYEGLVYRDLYESSD